MRAVKRFQERLGGIFGGGGGSGAASAGGPSAASFVVFLVVALLIWVAMGVYQVDQQERAVVLRLQHNIVDLLRQGLCVTINSDDPAYFGGYITENFLAVAEAHSMTTGEIAQFSFNAIAASFTGKNEKQRLKVIVHDYSH